MTARKKTSPLLTMSFARYRAIDAINASSLKSLGTSPLQYQWDQAHDRDTPSMLLGRATHTAVLEPVQYQREYVVYPGRRSGKAWDEFKAATAGQCILSESEHAKAWTLSDAVRKHRIAGPLLLQGVAERVLVWTDPVTGLRMKARLDWYDEASATLTDLKTAMDVSPYGFGKAAHKFGYPLQFGFYADAILANGLPLEHVKCIAVQNSGPPDVAVYRVGDDVLDLGRATYRDRLETLMGCRETNTWPGVCPCEMELELPPWAWPSDDLTYGGEAV